MKNTDAVAQARNDLAAGIAWGGGIVALALAATAARAAGWLEAETVTRIVIGATGLMVAWYGNRMPKAIAGTAVARRVQRVGGWSLALSGLLYAGLWAFAPMEVAVVAGCLAIGTGMVVTLVYGLRQRAASA